MADNPYLSLADEPKADDNPYLALDAPGPQLVSKPRNPFQPSLGGQHVAPDVMRQNQPVTKPKPTPFDLNQGADLGAPEVKPPASAYAKERDARDILRAPVAMGQSIIHGTAETIGNAGKIMARVSKDHPSFARLVSHSFPGLALGASTAEKVVPLQEMSEDIVNSNRKWRQQEDDYLKNKLGISKDTPLGQGANAIGDIASGVAKAASLGGASLPYFAAEGGIDKTAQALDENKPLGKALAAGGVSALTAATLMHLSGGNGEKAYDSLVKMALDKAANGTKMGLGFGAADLAVDKYLLDKDMTPDQVGSSLMNSVKTMLGYELAGFIPEAKLAIRGKRIASEYASPEDAHSDIAPKLADAYAKGNKSLVNDLFTRMQAVTYAEKAGTLFTGKKAVNGAENTKAALTVVEAAKTPEQEVKDALQEQGPAETVPREGSEGGNIPKGREGVGQGQQGEETPREKEEAQKEVAKPPVKIVDQTSYKGVRQSSLMGPDDEMMVAKDAKGNDIGKLWVTKKPDGFEVRKVEVDPKSRRQGVAEQLYVEAHNRYGTYKGATDQTPDGKAMNTRLRETHPEIFEDAQKTKKSPVEPLGEPKPVPIVFKKGMNLANIEKTLATLPEVKEGYTRLFRGSSPTGKFEDTFDSSKLKDVAPTREGEHYTDDFSMADYFRASYGKDASISYLDVPSGQAEQAKTRDREYILPSDKGPVDLSSLAKKGDAYMVPPDQIATDPERLQFRDTKEPDPGLVKKDGAYLGWVDESGELVVVDGHHSLPGAIEDGKDIPVRMIEAKDSETARAIGAMKNIAEGDASGRDAQRLFEETGITPEEVKAAGIKVKTPKIEAKDEVPLPKEPLYRPLDETERKDVLAQVKDALPKGGTPAIEGEEGEPGGRFKSGQKVDYTERGGAKTGTVKSEIVPGVYEVETSTGTTRKLIERALKPSEESPNVKAKPAKLSPGVVLNAMRSASDSTTGLVSVPDAVKALQAEGHSLADIHKTMMGMNRKSIELRPESGTQWLSKDEMELSPDGLQGSKLATARILEEAKPANKPSPKVSKEVTEHRRDLVKAIEKDQMVRAKMYRINGILNGDVDPTEGQIKAAQKQARRDMIRTTADLFGGQQAYEKLMAKLGLDPDATIGEIADFVRGKIGDIGGSSKETALKIYSKFDGMGKAASAEIAKVLHEAEAPEFIQHPTDTIKKADRYLRSLVAPSTISKDTLRTNDIMREHQARRAVGVSEIGNSIHKALSRLDSMGRKMQDLVTDAVEDPKKLARIKDPELRRFAETIGIVTDSLWAEIKNRGGEEGYLQNYLHMAYKNPEAAKVRIAEHLASLHGNLGYMMTRRGPKTHALARELGLEFQENNPARILLADAANKLKFIFAHDAIQDAINEGLVFEGKPKVGSYVELDPSILRAYVGKGNYYNLADKAVKDLAGAEEKLVKGEGVPHFYADPDVVRIITNALEPGFQGNPFYELPKFLNNTMNQVELGLSPFHSLVISNEIGASMAGIGFRDIAQGNIIKGIKNITTGLTLVLAQAQVASRGMALRDMLDNNKPIPEELGGEKFREYFLAAGGRTKQSAEYVNDTIDQMRKSWGKLRDSDVSPAIKAYLGVKTIKDAPFAAIEAAMKPVMEHYVPAAKLGIFHAMYMQERPYIPEDAKAADVARNAARNWDQVENTMGQLTYENLAWNPRFKQIMMIGLRAVGWKLGSKRAIYGAAVDLAKAVPMTAKEISRGLGITKPTEAQLAKEVEESQARGDFAPHAQFTQRLGWALGQAAITVSTATALGTINWLYHGMKKSDVPGQSGARDFIYPRMGSDADPDANRINVPSYMKESYDDYLSWNGLLTHGQGSGFADQLSSAASPLAHEVQEFATGKDYAGNTIGSQAKNLAKKFIPITFQAGIDDFGKTKSWGQAAATAARSGFVQKPKSSHLMTEGQNEILRRYNKIKAPRDQDLADQIKEAHGIQERMAEGKDIDDEALADLSPAARKAVAHSKGIGEASYSLIGKLPYKDAVDIYQNYLKPDEKIKAFPAIAKGIRKAMMQTRISERSKLKDEFDKMKDEYDTLKDAQ